MDVHEIGNRIKQARTLRNYTLDDIAHEIGVAKSTIQRYENGLIRRPKLPVLQAIAQSIQVNPAWLAGYDVPMEQNDYEDTTIAKRDAALADIEKILQTKKYSLCCESYDDNFFTIKNAFGQTIAGLYDYELLPRYEALKQNGNVTIDLLISSETAFFRYVESIGYYISKDTSGSDSRIE